MKLQSIAKEAAACRAAWAAQPKAKYGVHIHHEIAVEKLSQPIENRIAYILSGKPKKERALRLRLMRPITAEQYAEYNRVMAAALAEYKRATAPALAEYNRAMAAALAEYERVKAAALAEYDRAMAAAWAEYDRAMAPALAEYKRATAPAWAEYNRVAAPALAEYDRAMAAAHLAFCIPDCPFDGQSIFGGEK